MWLASSANLRQSGFIAFVAAIAPAAATFAWSRGRIVEASSLLGLRMLDYLIVSDERFHSFLDAGEIGGR